MQIRLTPRARRRLVFGRVESSIRRHQALHASELSLLGFDRRDQQVRIARPLIVDFSLMLSMVVLCCTDAVAELRSSNL
jgi:hypothetical protein